MSGRGVEPEKTFEQLQADIAELQTHIEGLNIKYNQKIDSAEYIHRQIYFNLYLQEQLNIILFRESKGKLGVDPYAK